MHNTARLMQKAYALQYCTCHILIQKATSKNKPRIDKRAISLSKLIRSYVHVCVLFVFLCYIDDICDGVGRPKQVMFLHNAQGTTERRIKVMHSKNC